MVDVVALVAWYVAACELAPLTLAGVLLAQLGARRLAGYLNTRAVVF